MGLEFATYLAKAIDQRPLKIKFANAALEFLNSQFRILHWQRGKRAEAIRLLFHFFSQKVVGAFGHLVRLAHIGDGLDRRSIERKDHPLYSVTIHQAQPLLMDVEEPSFQLRPMIRWNKAGQIAERFVNGEMFFERDFALHGLCQQLSAEEITSSVANLHDASFAGSAVDCSLLIKPTYWSATKTAETSSLP